MTLSFIKPLEPIAVDKPPASGGWLHEIKYDGYRMQLIVEDGEARAFSRSGLDWSREYAPVVAAATGLDCRSAIIDGEAVVQDEDGITDVGALRSAIFNAPHRVMFVAFDILRLDGADMRRRPLETRRAALAELMANAKGPFIFSEAFDGDGAELFREAQGLGLDGIISKKKGSFYRSGSSGDWLKAKAFVDSEFEVIGIDQSSTSGPQALLAAREGDALRFVGQAIVTLPGELKDAFWTYVGSRSAKASPVRSLKRQDVTWLEPGLTALARHLPGKDIRQARLIDLRVAERV